MDKLKTINIKGKDYVEVNTRIAHFRTAEEFKGWSLSSSIVSHIDGVVVIKASIYDEKSLLRATGHGCEKEGSTFINKTSYVENCETSAWGRALGNLGIGIDTSIASKEEVENAIANQKPSTASKTSIGKDEKMIDKDNIFMIRKMVDENYEGNHAKVMKKLGVSDYKYLTYSKYHKAYESMKEDVRKRV